MAQPNQVHAAQQPKTAVKKPRRPIGTPTQEFKARAERPVRILWKQFQNMERLARSPNSCPSEAQLNFLVIETEKRWDACVQKLRARMAQKDEPKRSQEKVVLPD